MLRIEQLIHGWAPVNALLIMPLFALANTGISFIGAGGAPPPLSVTPVFGGIFCGLLLGKPRVGHCARACGHRHTHARACEHRRARTRTYILRVSIR